MNKQNDNRHYPQRYALLGWPVQHSVSPEMQQAAFNALAIPATYELLAVEPPAFRTTVERLRNEGYCGWNVTVPHKEAAVQCVHQISDDAAAAGSVNTMINCNGSLVGYSTDGYGMAAALRESFGIDVAGGTFAFIGAGGAARAVSVYFARHAATAILLLNRTLEKAQHIAATIHAAAPLCRVQCLQLNQAEAIQHALTAADTIIQATSLGLHANDMMPLTPELLPDKVPVMDMIYRTTPFLAAAHKRGIPTADGRGMLLHQGARSFELWTKQKAPLDAMRNALTTALQARNT